MPEHVTINADTLRPPPPGASGPALALWAAYTILRVPWSQRGRTERWRKSAMLRTVRDAYGIEAMRACLVAAARLGGDTYRAGALLGSNGQAYVQILRRHGFTWDRAVEEGARIPLAGDGRAYVPPLVSRRLVTDWDAVGSEVFRNER